MIIPTDIDTYPWIQNSTGARAMCKAYNDWAYEYCQENPERLFFAALLPMQDPEVRRTGSLSGGGKGCRVGLVRPIDAMGNYPIQPKYARVWHAMEETGVVYGMHPFPALGFLKPPGYTEQYSGAELIGLSGNSVGTAAFVPDQCARLPGGSLAVGHDRSACRGSSIAIPRLRRRCSRHHPHG